MSPEESRTKNSWAHTRKALEEFGRTLICRLWSCIVNSIGNSCPLCYVPCSAKEAQENIQLASLVKVFEDLKNSLSIEDPQENVQTDHVNATGQSFGEQYSEQDLSDSVNSTKCKTPASFTREKAIPKDSRQCNLQISEKVKKQETKTLTPPDAMNVISETGNREGGELTSMNNFDAEANKLPVKKSLHASPAVKKIKRNIRGETPLHIAAIKNDVKRVQQLLNQGDDPNIKDHAGWTPLHEACIRGYSKVVKLLLDRDALYDIPAMGNQTPLHDAVQGNHIDIVRLLVERGADVFARNSSGMTPLMMAKTEEMKDILKTASSRPNPRIPLAEYIQPNQIVILASGLDDVQKINLVECASFLNAMIENEFKENGVSDCLRRGCKQAEEDYEVSGTKQLPKSFGPFHSRLNTLHQKPPLFDGCQFYFCGQFIPPSPPREELVALVQRGGGTILSREPRKPPFDLSELKFPYHGQTGGVYCYIVHQDVSKVKCFVGSANMTSIE